MELETLLEYFLPKEIQSYFDLLKVDEDPTGSLLLYLDEKSDKPKEHSDKNLISKGFNDPVHIQDFPIRDKAVYLIVRCRKWTDKETGKVYSTNWNLTAKGTSYTKEFASFLKELFR
jgi:cellulose biosynthesis protein BcsQ